MIAVSRANLLYRKPFVIVLGILSDTQTDLFEIALTTAAARIFARAAKNGEQYRGQNRNNCDNDQKFDQSES